jgi:hypothetical protein
MSSWTKLDEGRSYGPRVLRRRGQFGLPLSRSNSQANSCYSDSPNQEGCGGCSLRCVEPNRVTRRGSGTRLHVRAISSLLLFQIMKLRPKCSFVS